MKWVCTMGCGQSKSIAKSTGEDPDSNDAYHKTIKPENEKKLAVIPTDSKAGKTRDDLSHTNGGLHERGSKENMDVGRNTVKPRLPLQPQIANNLCTPGMPSKQVTASQLEFFKMLDEKIEKGRELTPDDDLSISTS